MVNHIVENNMVGNHIVEIHIAANHTVENHKGLYDIVRTIPFFTI
jgi:hypothetical protein